MEQDDRQDCGCNDGAIHFGYDILLITVKTIEQDIVPLLLLSLIGYSRII